MTVLVEMAGILGRDLQFSLDDDLTEASHGVTSKGGHFFFFFASSGGRNWSDSVSSWGSLECSFVFAAILLSPN